VDARIALEKHARREKHVARIVEQESGPPKYGFFKPKLPENARQPGAFSCIANE
jgi:hypothetical protein